jgi:hypothetical protein
MNPPTLHPNQVHVKDNAVTIDCSSQRAAVELAERLLHAKPVAWITLRALARLLADPTVVTQATGRDIATEDSIGLFLGPQAGARKQTFEECVALCEEQARRSRAAYEMADPEDGTHKTYLAHRQELAEELAKAIRNRMEGKS